MEIVFGLEGQVRQGVAAEVWEPPDDYVKNFAKKQDKAFKFIGLWLL